MLKILSTLVGLSSWKLVPCWSSNKRRRRRQSGNLRQRDSLPVKPSVLRLFSNGCVTCLLVNAGRHPGFVLDSPPLLSNSTISDHFYWDLPFDFPLWGWMLTAKTRWSQCWSVLGKSASLVVQGGQASGCRMRLRPLWTCARRSQLPQITFGRFGRGTYPPPRLALTTINYA